MRAVFGHARTVLAWLGEDCPDRSGRLSFDFLHWCSQQNLPSSQRRDVDLVIQYNKRMVDGERYTGPALASKSFVRLFDRRWFHRRWVVQEIAALRGQALLQCGEFAIEWSIIKHWALPILRFFMNSEDSYPAISILAMHENALTISPIPCLAAGLEDTLSRTVKNNDRRFVFRYFYAEGARRVNHTALEGRGRTQVSQASDAVRTLNQFHKVDCTDGRDRIGALSGLQNGLVFHIDYTATVEDNFVAFAAAIVQNGAALQLIRSAVQRKRNRDEPRIIPSWVPDWRIALPLGLELGKDESFTVDWARYVVVDGAQLKIPMALVRHLSYEELIYLEDKGHLDHLWRAESTDPDCLLGEPLSTYYIPCISWTSSSVRVRGGWKRGFH